MCIVVLILRFLDNIFGVLRSSLSLGISWSRARNQSSPNSRWYDWSEIPNPETPQLT